MTTRGGSFSVAGAGWRFGGTNTYYLHQQSHYMIDSALNDAAAMSLAVVRAWAFADGSAGSYTALQPKPYVYDNAAFDSLDYAIYKAGQLGLRLVLALVNNWPDYGGMAQYVTWFLGLPDDSYGAAVNHDKFYSTTAIQDCYRAYVQYVLTRYNRYTGLRYNEDPTIMTFELANEPRSRSDKTGQRAADLGHADQRIRQGAGAASAGHHGRRGLLRRPGQPRLPVLQLRGGPLEGLPRAAHDRLRHGPPVSAGLGGEPVIQAGDRPGQPGGPRGSPTTCPTGRRWASRWCIEEYGLAINAAQGMADEAARDAGYQAWTARCWHGGAGDQFWLLTSRVDDGSFYPDYDGYRIIWDNDPGKATNAAARLLSAHAKAMVAAS